jgi:hypothetical protein
MDIDLRRIYVLINHDLLAKKSDSSILFVFGHDAS